MRHRPRAYTSKDDNRESSRSSRFWWAHARVLDGSGGDIVLGSAPYARSVRRTVSARRRGKRLRATWRAPARESETERNTSVMNNASSNTTPSSTVIAPVADTSPFSVAAPAPSSPRALVLEQVALDAGRAWAMSFCNELAREGRVREGGWPGTIPEARGHALSFASKALHRSSMPGLSYEEKNALVRATYEQARRFWNARRDEQG